MVSGVLGLTGAGIGYSALGVVWEMMQTFTPSSFDWLPAVLGGSNSGASAVDAIVATPPDTPASREMVFAALGVSAMSMGIKEWLYRYTV